MKKFITIILAVCLLACSLVPAFASSYDAAITGSSEYKSGKLYVTFQLNGNVCTNGKFTVTFDAAKVAIDSCEGATINPATGVITFAQANNSSKLFTVVFSPVKQCGTVAVTLTPEYVQKNAEVITDPAINLNVQAGTVNAPFGSHSFAWQQTVTPTHKNTGWMYGRCSVCGAETGYALAALNHTFSEEWKSDETGHWHECECGEKTEVEAHTMKWVVDKEAEVGKEGSKHEECEVCGYKGKTETIPAKEAPVDPTPQKDNTVLFIGIGCGLLLLLLIILLVKRKKDKK